MSEQSVNISAPRTGAPGGTGQHSRLAQLDWDRLRAEVFAQTAGPVTSSKRIAELIIAAIRKAWLLPGRRLRETELAAALGASRTPLREALHGLKQQGILEADADGGLRVRLLSWRDVTEFYELRGTLEGLAARLAARNASAAEREVIAGLKAKEQQLMADGAPAQDLARLNHAFHQAIVNGARNAFLQDSLTQQNQILILLGPTAYRLAERRLEISAEHGTVCAAILARDEVAAATAMQAHLHAALTARLAVLSEHVSAKDD